MAIGAASRPPGRASRRSSPNAMKAPNATAGRTGGALTARLAKAASASMPATAISSSRPESTDCQVDHAAAGGRVVVTGRGVMRSR